MDEDEIIEAVIGIERVEPLSITVTVADNGFVIQSDAGFKVALTLRQMLRAVAQIVRDDERALREAFAKAFEASRSKERLTFEAFTARIRLRSWRK